MTATASATATAVLVVTHGPLATALLETASMLVADLSRITAIEFHPGEGPEDLAANVEQALADLGPGPVLSLVDLPGGTPARVLGTAAAEGKPVEIVTGVNLPMLLEVLMTRSTTATANVTDTTALAAMAETATTAGTDGIVNVTALLRNASGRIAEGG